MERSVGRKLRTQQQGDIFSDLSGSEHWGQGDYRKRRKTNEAIEKDPYIQVSVNSLPRKIAKSKSIHQYIHAGQDIIII